MGRSDTVKIILMLCVLVILLIAMATKAAHWDRVEYKNYTKGQFPEVYPGLEGCIVIDTLLMVSFILAIVFGLVEDLRKFSKFLLIFIVVLMFIRIVLAMLFLAGDDQHVKKLIDYCNDTPDEICYRGRTYCYASGCGQSFFKTLKGAWVWEIITMILFNVLGAVALFLMYKETSS